jgi:hypothetical protein
MEVFVRDRTGTIQSAIALATVAALAIPLLAGTTIGSLTFSNTPLIRPEGGSEPEISIAVNGTMAIVGLQWLFDPNFFGTHLWTGSFGSTPTFRGLIDAALQQPGKAVFGSGDADVDFGSNGTLHSTTLIFLLNAHLNRAQIGVSAISCPHASTSFNIASCTEQIIDTGGADRSWITSDAGHVYISYHDAANSSLIHVQRSDDDGLTWHRVGDPIVGQDGATADATFNNAQGKIIADPISHNVYDIYIAGQPGIQKATTAAFNNVFVSRSTDMGKSWRANLVFGAPLFTGLNNVFPALAVDPVTGKLYAAWSDAHTIGFSSSSDQGSHWSAPVTVNVSPANTAVFPWISARGGTVDVVYYATTASSKDDPAAVWNVYLAQTVNDGASFTQSKVSNTSNHVGVVCTNGTGCAAGTRNLLDLFQVAIDPLTGRAAIIYTDDTLTKDSSGAPLPQVVLAQQN